MTIDLHDIQGLLRRGYGDMDHASFLLLGIEDPGATRRWLGDLVTAITDSATKPNDGRLNIAFTHAGLEGLGLERSTLDGFSREFREGMTTGRRQRILGDVGDSAPERWAWGGPDQPAVHLLLLVYAPTAEALRTRLAGLRRGFGAGGLCELGELDTIRLSGRKEHFGFRDGIAQPGLVGFHESDSPTNNVALGEMVLGYPNEAGEIHPGPGRFGDNGSYLVVRQLRQQVGAFWRFLDRATRDADGAAQPDHCLGLAAKMVGRWPSGAPLVRFPDHDPDAGKPEGEWRSDAANDRFGFHATDPQGDRCPLGSHIRRSNPRDGLDPSPRVSTKVSNRHRILRRGRAYGSPLAASMAPSDILAAEETGERGLHFLCFNADIAQQFEFIQQDWINSPKFEGLFYDAADPITGAHDPDHPERTHSFTVQGTPVRRRFTGVPRFVDVRGGAYFFMPGLRAIRHLAD